MDPELAELLGERKRLMGMVPESQRTQFMIEGLDYPAGGKPGDTDHSNVPGIFNDEGDVVQSGRAAGTKLPTAPIRAFMDEDARGDMDFFDSVGKRFGEAATIAKDILLPQEGLMEPRTSMVKNLGQLAIDSGKSSKGFPAPAGSNSFDTFVAEGFGKPLTDVNAFVRDPTMLPATVGGLFSGRSGLMGKLGNLDPLVATGNALGATARGAAKLASSEKLIPAANTVAAGGIALTAGRGFERSKALIRAGKSGRGNAAKDAIEHQTAGDLGESAIKSVNDKFRDLNKQRDHFIDNAPDVDITSLKKDIIGNISEDADGFLSFEGGTLDDLGIKLVPDPNGKILIRIPGENSSKRVSIETPPDILQGPMNKVVTGLREILEKPDNMSVKNLDANRRLLSNMPEMPPVAENAITRLRQKVINTLEDQKGYDAVHEPLKDFTTQVKGPRGLEERLKVDLSGEGSRGAVAQDTGEGLAKVFDEGFGQRDKLAAIKELDAITPNSLEARAAGIGFGGSLPSGLIGRNQFVQAILPFIGVGGVAVTAGAATALLSLPLIAVAFVPKFAGKALIKLGAAEAKVAPIQKMVRDAIAQGKGLGMQKDFLRTASLGSFLDRMEELSSKEPDPTHGLMKRLSNARLPSADQRR